MFVCINIPDMYIILIKTSGINNGKENIVKSF